MVRIRLFLAAPALLAVGLTGCDREEKQPVAAPPAAPSPTDPCAGASTSPIAGLPGFAHGYCIDPRSDVRRYGVSEAAPLDAACVELFNVECDLYKSYGLQGVKTLRYIAKNGARAEVSVVVSSFRRSTGAFGFFTQRILGTKLPSQIAFEPLEVEAGRAVAGAGVTVVWRGKTVVELAYVSEEETPTEIEQSSPGVLHPLSSAIAKTLVGPERPDRPVLLLEELGADSLGVSVQTDGILDVAGTGPGAVGYFSKGEHPHRVLIAERRDKQGSSDLLRLLRRDRVSKKLKGRDVIRLRRTQDGASPETWFMSRNDEVLLAVGPLEIKGSPATSTPEEREAEQDAWEDFALSRILEISKVERSFVAEKVAEE